MSYFSFVDESLVNKIRLAIMIKTVITFYIAAI